MFSETEASPWSVCAASLVRAVGALLLGTVLLPAYAQQDPALTRTTTFGYDSNNGLLLWQKVDPNSPNNTHCVETVYDYDTYGNKKRVTVRNCGGGANEAFTTRVTDNAFAANTTLGYPAGAYLTSSASGTEIDAQGNVKPMAKSEATFNPKFGTASTATEVALGNASCSLTKTTKYDALGRVKSQSAPSARADPASCASAITESRVELETVYCLGSNAPATPAAACIRVIGLVVPVSYPSQRLVDANGAVATNATVNLISAYFVESTPMQTVGTTPTVVGVRSRVHYDSLHREIVKETETFDGRWSRTITGYDALGNVAASWGAHFVEEASPNTAPPDELRQWTAARDLLHRVVATKQKWRGVEGAGATDIEARIEYAGLKTTAVVPASGPGEVERRRVTIKNAAGEVAQTIDPLGATLNMAYDAFGNLVKTVDPLGFTTTITYTAGTARFKESMTDPDRGTWSYKYDALGQLKTQTDARGKVTAIKYDALGRMTEKTYPGSTTPSASWKHSVSDQGVVHPQCANGLPRLCDGWTGLATARVTSRQLLYDALGRNNETIETLDRAYSSKIESYDNLGRPTVFKYPSGLKLKYTYSTGSLPAGKKPGFLVTVADNANASKIFWSIDTVGQPFDANGNLLQAKLNAGGVTALNSFDPISGKAFALRAGIGTSTNNVLNQAYTYDRFNNLKTRSNGFSGGIETFIYDLLDRLTSYEVDQAHTAAKRTITAGYNALGNILTKSDVGGYYYNAARPHAVTWAGGNAYNYDANGNVLGTSGMTTRTHTWTDFNLPNDIVDSGNGTKVTFQYDDQYKRVKEEFTTSTTTRTVYMLHPNNAGGLSFEREETKTGATITRVENRHYIAVGGAVIGVVKTLSANAAGSAMVGTVSSDANLTLFWHKDSLGSIVAITNGANNVLERPGFDAWGRRLLEDRRVDTSATGPAHGDRGYTGHEHLDEFKLIHMNGRVYDPALARFLSPDPFVQSPTNLQNHNAYSYVLNNPLRYTDPSGELIELAIFVAGFLLAQNGNEYWSMAGTFMMMYALAPGGGGLVDTGLGVAANRAAAAAISAALTPGASAESVVMSAFFANAYGVAGGLAEAGVRFTTQQLMMHMMLGCLQQSMAGGSCGPGAMAAGFAKAASVDLPSEMSHAEKIFGGIATAMVGGTASVIGGGKFANGAFQAGFGYLFNGMASYLSGEEGQRLLRNAQAELGREVIGEKLQYRAVDANRAPVEIDGKILKSEIDALTVDKNKLLNAQDAKHGTYGKFTTNELKAMPYLARGDVQFYGPAAAARGLDGVHLKDLMAARGWKFGGFELWNFNGGNKATRQMMRMRARGGGAE
jgi:RHS repeat-associated protein